MKRIIATLIAVMLLFSVFSVINVSADIGYGNIDKKDGVTVSDALLALQGHREQNDLDDNGEQDQGQAVAVQKVIEKQQQPGKWH